MKKLIGSKVDDQERREDMDIEWKKECYVLRKEKSVTICVQWVLIYMCLDESSGNLSRLRILRWSCEWPQL